MPNISSEEIRKSIVSQVTLPPLGEGIEKAKVAYWHVKVNDHVQEDADLVELVTDKATFNVSASASGVVQRICVGEGQEAKIGEVVRRIDPYLVDRILVIDDGSTDNTPNVAAGFGAEVLRLDRVYGFGVALRAGMGHARKHGFDIACILAGNNKDDPSELPVHLGHLHLSPCGNSAG